MTTPDPDAAARSRRELRESGEQLATWGAVMATLCGTCTAGFSGASIREALQSPGYADDGSFLLFVVFGGPPTLIGLAMLFVGVRRYHQARDP